MVMRVIPSTKAQNNFGRLLDDVVQNRTRYVIKRRSIPQAVLLSLADLQSLLAAGEVERNRMRKLIGELGPTYHLGENVHE